MTIKDFIEQWRAARNDLERGELDQRRWLESWIRGGQR